MGKNSDFAKEFIHVAQKICELESQTFLTDESKKELKGYQQILEKFQSEERHIQFSKEEWRILIAFMCTFQEWCKNTRFFDLNVEQQKFILLENPVDWYYKNLVHRT